MKIKFLGVGSSFTTAEYYHSNILIETSTGRRMLFDCGGDIRFSMKECGIDACDLCSTIDSVYISHLHQDHIGGLEWLAFNTYFSPNPCKPELIMESKLMDKLWESSLKGGLGCTAGKIMCLDDYFKCTKVHEDEPFVWENFTCTMIKLPHVISGEVNQWSFGLLIKEDPTRSVFISSDAQFKPKLITQIGNEAQLIFHDCETSAFPTGIHAHYDQLKSLHPQLKKKMWLYHYQPDPTNNPLEDGFPGFVRKGMQFEI